MPRCERATHYSAMPEHARGTSTNVPTVNFDHSPDCPHCVIGCEHPHTDSDPVVYTPHPVPTVPGSRMRRGGAFTFPDGLTLGGGEWKSVRCVFCRTEAMTPVEVIPVFPEPLTDTDGTLISHCGACQHDMDMGYKPGHNPHRRRRQRQRH